MFFDFKKTPNIKAALKADVDPDEFTLKLASEPFPQRHYKRIAVRVISGHAQSPPVAVVRLTVLDAGADSVTPANWVRR